MMAIFSCQPGVCIVEKSSETQFRQTGFPKIVPVPKHRNRVQLKVQNVSFLQINPREI